MAQTIEVAFMHPRKSTTFRAEIEPSTTGATAVSELVKAKFLDAPSANAAYSLVHQKTGNTIPLSASLVASGVGADDVVAVVETSAGAEGEEV